jgi:hypothetical protein
LFVLNLAYRWFRRIDPEDKVPDRSGFSRYRRGKFRESGLLRQVFEATVERCPKEDLVSGEGFAVDASLIPADADKPRSIAARDWCPEVARQVAGTDRAAKACAVSCDGRKKVEVLFARRKSIPTFTQHRLRGPNGAKDAFVLAVTAESLRKLAKLRPAFSQMKVATWPERQDQPTAKRRISVRNKEGRAMELTSITMKILPGSSTDSALRGHSLRAQRRAWPGGTQACLDPGPRGAMIPTPALVRDADRPVVI